MTIGRSTKADYRIEGMGVSNFHVYLKRGKNAQGATIFMATDVSLNGTGIVSEGRPATEASPMPRQVPVIPPEGSGLLIPMRSSGQHRQGDGPHVLWLRATDHLPIQEAANNQIAPTPSSRTTPGTWLTSWASLPDDITVGFRNFIVFFWGRDLGTLKSDIVSNKHPQIICSDLRFSN